MKRRFFAALLALPLVASLAPAAVFATETDGETGDPAEEIEETQEAEDEAPEEAEEEPAEEEDPAQEEDPAEEEDPAQEAEEDPASGEAVTASLETEETEAVALGSAALTAVEGTKLTDGGSLTDSNYYLDSDVELETDITIPNGSTVTIDLCGHTLTGTGNTYVIRVAGTLILTDSSTGQTGIVTGGSGSTGGGVYVYRGTFTMKGGTISGNTSTSYGGGVYVTGGGSFTMEGGTISGNVATSGGGGVYVYGSKSKFTMTGGTISGNGSVEGNETKTQNGGGVYVNTSSFDMSGGEITGNTATTTGGGVTINGVGSFTMTNGTITGNTAASYGGGVYGGGTFTVSGTPDISGNTAGGESGTASNVHLTSGRFITLGGDLADGASIGVTKEISSGLSVQITTTETTNYYSKAVNYITADNTAYKVKTNSDGYLELCGEAILGMVTIDGDLTYGQTLTAELSDETLAAGATYQWMRGTSYITDATEATYTLTATDVGTTITVVVSHDGYIGTLTDTTTETVQKASLTAVISGTTTKTYDGTTTVTDTENLTLTLDGVVGNNLVPVTADFVYADADAGTGKTVKAINIELHNLLDCYDLASTTAEAAVGTIEPQELNGDDFEVETVDGGYTGSPITQTVTNTSGLEAGTDYTVSYDDNINAGLVTLTITGQGNYTGTLTYSFAIEPATPALALSAVTKTYDGQAVSDPAVTVTLVNNEEYTGTPTITYYAVGSDGTETELDEAPSAVGSYKVVVTVSDAGANYETVSAAASFTIIEADMTAEITGFNVPYDGQPHEVSVTAEDGAAVTKTEGDDPFTNHLTQTIAFGTVTYTSSNTDVAAVDESGQVTIVGAGTAVITAVLSGTDSYTAVTASYTLTVAAAPVETPTETENQIVVDDLAQVPEGLQSLYSTVDDLKAALFARVSISDPTYTEDNVAYYDVKLQIWNGETGQWEDATEEDFPAEGITVTLPYPTGTDSTYDFVVAHMFTVSSQRLGITAGDTELPAVTKTDDGLVVTLTGLSPVAVAWKEAEAEATPAPTATATPAATTTPNTGDGNTPLLWLAILALCGVGLGIVTGKRKRVR